MSTDKEVVYVGSPLGVLKLVANNDALLAVHFCRRKRQITTIDNSRHSHPLLATIIGQLCEYFAHERRSFRVPLKFEGTVFQQRVWRALQKIPHGKTASYGEIAQMIDNPRAVRAVGGANHCNPFSIVVPCHRVIGSSGDLTGYGGGLWRKRWLIEHEQRS